MSAPNQGRQSPEPEQQTDAQLHQTSKPNNQGAAPGGKAAEDSANTLKNLESNPKGPLADEAASKTK